MGGGRAIPGTTPALPVPIFSHIPGLGPYLRPNEGNFSTLYEVSEIGSRIDLRIDLRMTLESTLQDPPWDWSRDALRSPYLDLRYPYGPE